MLFLIEYEPSSGSVAKISAYEDSEWELAENDRLSLELKFHRQGVMKEIVLLEAPSEDDLRRTHRRYFENLEQLARSAASRI